MDSEMKRDAILIRELQVSKQTKYLEARHKAKHALSSPVLYRVDEDYSLTENVRKL